MNLLCHSFSNFLDGLFRDILLEINTVCLNSPYLHVTAWVARRMVAVSRVARLACPLLASHVWWCMLTGSCSSESGLPHMVDCC